MNALAHRVIYRSVGGPYLRGLILPLLAILFGVAMADAVTDWTALRQRIAGLDPSVNAIQFTGLILAWSLVAGRALQPVWQLPVIAFLVRQPLSRWRWAACLLPSLAVAFVPVAAIWWLAPRSGSPVVHYVGFVGLAWPIILGASGSGLASLLLTASGSLVLGLLMFGYFHWPWVAYAALVATVAVLPAGVALIPRELARPHAGISGRLTGRHVLAVLVRRDLRCVWRGDRKGLLGAWAVGLVAASMMLAFRRNGGIAGREAFEVACIVLTIAASPLYELLEALKAGVGRELMRRRWPLDHAQRAIALMGLAAALVGPSLALIVVFGSTMGVARELVFALFACATVSLVAGLFAGMLVVERSAIGWSYLLLVGHALVALALPGWAYAALGAALVPAGFALTARGLRAFSDKTEGSYGQAA